ncbi:MAG: hypothetical protein J1E39_09545 [Eubacterium sp.]|nr:hypothetical protein [Eubacterium sp.]
MQLVLEIFKKARYFFIIGAAAFGMVGVALKMDIMYLLCILFILLFIASDATVMVLQRKLGIQIKYHENMFSFRKRK